MDNDETVRVSVLANAQDVHLLREIAKWRRANDVTYFQWRPGRGLGVFTEWYRYVDKKRRTVSYEPSDATVLVDGDYYGSGCFEKLPVRTVTEAVDVLVALGYLPPRFSSAYRSGWDQANKFALDREAGRWVSTSEFAALVPATEVAW